MNTIRTFLKKFEQHRSKILFTLFLFGCAWITVHFLSIFAIPESEYNFLGTTKTVSLAPGKPVMQYFTARQNNLNQIRVVTGKWNNIQHDEFVLFELADANCETAIASKKMTQSVQKQGAYTIFSFPIIPHSAGKKFCFRATFVANEPRTKGKPALAATNNPDPKLNDRILVDTNKNKICEGQTLKLRPAYTNGSLLSNLHELLGRISQYKPALLKGWPIGTIFLLVIFGSVALAGILSTNTATKTKRVREKVL